MSLTDLQTNATWISTEEDSVFQSWHINKLLKEQIECLLKEEEIIEANIRDVEKDISSMEVELSRIKQAETMKIHLEAELQTAQKTLEEEHVLELEMDLYLRKLEKDNEDFNLRILMLSEESSALMASRKASQNSHRQLQLQIRKLERKLQERILDSTAEDEVFIKMQHQAQELEESIKEYEAVIQVLQNKEKTLQDQLFAAEEEKARNLTLPGNVLNINPKSLLFEIANAEMEAKIREKAKNQKKQIFGGRMNLKWILVLLWWLAGILLATTLVTFLVICTCLSSQTVTEAYQRTSRHFWTYYFWSYMKLHNPGLLPL